MITGNLSDDRYGPKVVYRNVAWALTTLFHRSALHRDLTASKQHDSSRMIDILSFVNTWHGVLRALLWQTYSSVGYISLRRYETSDDIEEIIAGCFKGSLRTLQRLHFSGIFSRSRCARSHPAGRNMPFAARDPSNKIGLQSDPWSCHMWWSNLNWIYIVFCKSITVFGALQEYNSWWPRQTHPGPRVNVQYVPVAFSQLAPWVNS